MKFQLKWLVVVCIAGLLFACDSRPSRSDATQSTNTTPAKKRESTTSGNIYIAVDETFQPMVHNLLAVFEETYPDAHITPIYLPVEKAIDTMLASDSIRLVVSARDLRRDEKYVLKQQATSAKTSKIATDAVALIINRANTDSMISQAHLKGILDGSVSSWKDISPNSPLGNINLVFDHGLSSTAQYLKDTLMGGAEIKPVNAYAAGDNPKVVEYVSQNKSALGVIGLAWISDSDSQQAVGFRKNITICKLENPEPCGYPDTYHQPYQGLIKLGCYPLHRSVYMISRETRFGLGSGFFAFTTSQDRGQRMILKSGLVPAFGVPRIVQFPAKSKK